MNCLFLGGSIKDKGGLAMVQGAVNGILRLEPEAAFQGLFPAEHNAENHLFKTFIDPGDREAAFTWANVFLDVGGLFRNQPYRCEYVRQAKARGISYVWMSQSFMPGVDAGVLEGTTVIARGRNSAANVEEATGTWPAEAADLSFLVQAERWRGESFQRAYTTHFNKPVSHMFETYREVHSVQVIWKKGLIPEGIEKYGGQSWEQKLPIRHVAGSVERNFGLIASVREVHAARYRAAWAARKAGIRPTLCSTYRPKYDDLMDFYGKSPERLEESAMISCEAAVAAARGGKHAGS